MSSVQRLEHKRQLKEQASEEGQNKRWDSRTDWARVQAEGILKPVARVMARVGIHPNTVTFLGMLLQFGVGIVFALGYIKVGGWLLLAVAPVDALDGALARLLGKQSRFGAFLDSTLDRFSDAALITGLMVHYMINRGIYLEVVLLLISLVAAMMVSYVRARAEALDFPCRIGVLTRMERVVLIGALSALGLPSVMMWMLATLSVFTVFQRIFYVYVVFQREDMSD